MQPLTTEELKAKNGRRAAAADEEENGHKNEEEKIKGKVCERKQGFRYNQKLSLSLGLSHLYSIHTISSTYQSHSSTHFNCPSLPTSPQIPLRASPPSPTSNHPRSLSLLSLLSNFPVRVFGFRLYVDDEGSCDAKISSRKGYSTPGKCDDDDDTPYAPRWNTTSNPYMYPISQKKIARKQIRR